MSEEAKTNIDIGKTTKRDKIKVFINSTIAVFLISAASVALSYAYNGGYNAYYGIPMSLTTASPSGLIMGIPFICKLIMAAITISYIVVIIHRIICCTIALKRKEDNARNFRISLKVVAIVSILNWGLCIWMVSLDKSFYSIVSFIFATLVMLYCMYLLITDIRLENRGKHLQDGIDSFLAESLQNEFGSATAQKAPAKARRNPIPIGAYLNVWPSNFFVFGLFIGISMFALLFSLAYMYGNYNAKKQEYYYFIGHDRIAISIYDSNIIATNVSKNNATGQYSCGGKFYLIPMNNLEMEFTNSGKIESKYDQSNSKKDSSTKAQGSEQKIGKPE